MKKHIGIILMAVIIAGLIGGMWHMKSLSNKDIVSIEILKQEFDKLAIENVIEFDIQDEEESRILTIRYLVKENVEDERALDLEYQALFDRVKVSDVLHRQLDQAWLIGISDGKVVSNVVMNNIKPYEKTMVWVFILICGFIGASIGSIIRYLRNEKKRNLLLEGKEITDYSLEELKLYAEYHKTDDVVLYRIARLLEEQGTLDEAVEYVKKALSINPKATTYRRYLGHLCYEMGEYKEAISHYKGSQTLKTLHKDCDYYLTVGFCYIRLGDDKKAVKHLKQARGIIKQQENNNPKEVAELLMMVDKVLIDAEQSIRSKAVN